MDIKLSKRMQAVADMVVEKRVVDIGCDHAFVSIYLAGRSEVNQVIAMDVKKGPIEIARANVAAHRLEDKIEVRMSDGFNKLSVGEADVAVIAGMGGYLMIDILEGGKEHLDAGIKLVLQPQSDIRAVREYLVDVGYIIQDEDMLIEDGKYYSIIKAAPAGEKTADCYCHMKEYTRDEFIYGPVLLKKKHPVLKSYLELSRDKNKELMNKLTVSGSEKSRERGKELAVETEYIDNIIQKYFG